MGRYKLSTELSVLGRAIPEGNGLALDLGGGEGKARAIIAAKGWHYVNLDLRPRPDSVSVSGDAHALPFADGVFSLVVLKDALEHFRNPWQAMHEVRRVLTCGGRLVICVPFLWPFHGDDYYRYTPLALKELLSGFRIVRFDSPLWVFSVLGNVLAEAALRMKLGFLCPFVRELTRRLDAWLQPRRAKPRAFAGAYLIVAVKQD